jgi:hypothetical protein
MDPDPPSNLCVQSTSFSLETLDMTNVMVDHVRNGEVVYGGSYGLSMEGIVRA